MDELAVTDGMPPPSGLPDGELILTTGTDGQLTIGRADPRILISAELLASIYVTRPPGATISAPPQGENGTPFWMGAVLKVGDASRTVVYCITEYVPRVHGYIAEWPD